MWRWFYCYTIGEKVTDLTVLTTGSRLEIADWCKKMGTDHIINHKDLINELHKAGFKNVDFIVDFWTPIAIETVQYGRAHKTSGHIASITGTTEPVALNKLKSKSASFSWELMYTRSMLKTEDMIEQHYVLNYSNCIF